MINVIISGCNGKMGRVVTRLIQSSDDMRVVCGFDVNTAADGGFPVVAPPFDFAGKADVIIDFSHPSSLPPLLEFAQARSMPVVVATTGLAVEDVKQLHAASGRIPVFYSANMSLGVNLLIDLVTKAARVLEESFDIEITERHHNQKIDAPSGTALAIADAVSRVLAEPYSYVYDRHNVRKKRTKREIGIHAVRGGTIVGDHTVIFAGQDEVIEVTHRAASKEVFAVGAVRAARFLSVQDAGLYDMKSLVSSL